jgi:hypothetical protein
VIAWRDIGGSTFEIARKKLRFRRSPAGVAGMNSISVNSQVMRFHRSVGPLNNAIDQSHDRVSGRHRPGNNEDLRTRKHCAGPLSESARRQPARLTSARPR